MGSSFSFMYKVVSLLLKTFAINQFQAMQKKKKNPFSLLDDLYLVFFLIVVGQLMSQKWTTLHYTMQNVLCMH